MQQNHRKLFGTDGIRGRANSHPMTAEISMQLGRALTVLFQRKDQTAAPKIIVGKDTRLSGYMLETAMTSGITSMGGTALLLGPLPTPAVAYHIRAMRAHGGVMISASHNPYYDNGLKVFGPDGYKLDDALEAEIEKLMHSQNGEDATRPSPEQLGRARRLDDASGRYLTQLKTIFGRDFDLAGKKIVFDGANGAAYDCGKKLFEELGAEVKAINCEPNGRNINENCGQSDPKILSEMVLKTQSDLGIGVDGDADRLLLVDEKGEVLSGEHFLYETAVFLKETGRLAQNAVVSTSMANESLSEAFQKAGISFYRAQVGDRYVVEMLKEKGGIFGGETSGHYLFLDQNTTADGLFSALEILALLHRKKMKASQLRTGFKLFPQKLVTIKVREKIPLEQIPKLKSAISDLEAKYSGHGRVNVRYSGTESSLRLMVEGPEAKTVEKDVKALADLVQLELGVGT